MTASALPLEGKVALVTGGSRGLGREMVLAFARAGADTVIVSRKIESCEELAQEVTAATGRRALPIACHVGDWEAQDELVAQVYEEFGTVDVLVNNAGMSPLYSSLEQISEALFDKVFDVNLKGAFRLTTLIAPRMVAAGGGSIINISSIAAQRPTPGDLPYAAAKAGLNVMTKGFAQAYGPAVRVNAIMAGPFLTDISKAWDMDAVAEKLQALPMSRAGDPGEIIGAAMYLAGPDSSYTSGAIIPVDGGRTAMR